MSAVRADAERDTERDTVLSAQGLADYLGVPLATVYQMNWQRSGPPYFRVGRSVRYRLSEVHAWAKAGGTGAKVSYGLTRR